MTAENYPMSYKAGNGTGMPSSSMEIQMNETCGTRKPKNRSRRTNKNAGKAIGQARI
jgi:hypothetical protein